MFYCWGFPDGSGVKNLPANAGDAGLSPGSGRSLGGGHGDPLQYSCWGNSMDRGAWWATYSPYGHKESDRSKHACFIVNTLEPLDVLCEGF